MKRFPRLGCTLGLALATPVLTFSAEPPDTGSIEGRVLNSTRGEYVERARVTVDGTLLETFSEPDGTFRLVGVPAGAAIVKTFYTGFAAQTQGVAVTAGQIAHLDVDLSSGPRRPEARPEADVVKLAEFYVSTSRDMDGAAIAINEQRFAPNIKSVVSTDEFGSVAEGSVGEFLKFLPGITIEYENGALARGVSINGVPSENVPITVDGFNLASAGGNNVTARGVQLDMVSMTSVSRMEVAYTPTPESQGSALGGSVNMIPRSAFERSRPQFNFSAYLSFRDNARDFRRSPGPFESPTRKVHPGFDFSYIRPVTPRFGFTLSGGHSTNGTKEEFIQNTWRGGGSTTNGNAFPNTTPDRPYLTSTQVRDGTKRAARTSVGGSIDYKLTANDRLSFSFQYYYIDFLVMNRTLAFNITRVPPGDFTPTSTRGAPGAGDLQLSNVYRDRRNSTYTPTLTWRHNGPAWKAEAGLGLSRGGNTFRAVDKGFFSNTTARRTGATVSFADIFYLRPGIITVADATGTAPLDPYDINNYVLTSANSNPVTTYNVQRGAHGSLAREFAGRTPLTVKAGVDFRQDRRDQRNATIAYNYVGADGRPSTTPVGNDDGAARFFAPSFSQRTPPFGFPRIQWLDNEAVWDHYAANPAQFVEDANGGYRSAVNGSKYAEELVSSSYLRGDLQLLQRRLKLVGGVRAEQTNIDAQGPLTDPTRNYRRDASGNVILVNGNPVLLVPTSDALGVSRLTLLDRAARAEKEYLRLFPSLNASFNVRENLIARASYFHSIGRPNYNQYAGGLTLPDEERPPGPGNRISVNNAAIKPWTARTVSARLEYYFEGVGQVSVGAFRRDFENFFGNVVFTPTPEFLALYGLDPATYGPYEVSTQHNIEDTVRMTGIDVSYKQALTFLPHWARGLQVFANGSAQRAIGDASANFAGYIPRKASWGFSLVRERFNVRMNWSYQGRNRGSAVAAGPSIDPGTFNWSAKRGFLDVNGEYFFTKRLAAYASLRNVNDTPDDVEITGPNTAPPSQLRSREYAGSLWNIGIRGIF